MLSNLNVNLNAVRDLSVSYIIGVLSTLPNQELKIPDSEFHLPFLSVAEIQSVCFKKPETFLGKESDFIEESIQLKCGYEGSHIVTGVELSTDDLLVLADAIYNIINTPKDVDFPPKNWRTGLFDVAYPSDGL